MVVTWLHVASSRKNAHTPAHVHTGLLHKQGTQAMVSDCAHTHTCVCCRRKESAHTHTCVCVADARNPWSRFQLTGFCSDCACVQPPMY